MSAPSDPFAEAWSVKPGCIDTWQGLLMLTAARSFGMETAELATMIAAFSPATHPADLTLADYDWIMDRFVGWGFRHPALPLVSPEQFTCLDQGRRQLRLTGREFLTLMRKETGAPGRRRLDGVGFLALWSRLGRDGATTPRPRSSYMTRRCAWVLRMCVYRAGLPERTFAAMRMLFGAVMSTAELDERGYSRLLAWFEGQHVPASPPAPRVPAQPGMATQAQANLIWRLWVDMDGWSGDVSPEALERAIGSMLGLPGGLASLTRAGARSVIDRFMVPLLNDRRSAERAEG